MPRTVRQIIEQADELSARFESHEPRPAAIKDAAALRAVREAFKARADAELRLADAVAAARRDGHSWAAIGAMVATSGEAARQRYALAGTAVAAEGGRGVSLRDSSVVGEVRGRPARLVAAAPVGYGRRTRVDRTGGAMASGRTGKKAASNAGKALGAKSKAAAKSAAGSALSQTKSSGVTGKKAASNASSTLSAKKSSKSAKSAAGSALTQTPSKSTKSKKK